MIDLVKLFNADLNTEQVDREGRRIIPHWNEVLRTMKDAAEPRDRESRRRTGKWIRRCCTV